MEFTLASQPSNENPLKRFRHKVALSQFKMNCFGSTNSNHTSYCTPFLTTIKENYIFNGRHSTILNRLTIRTRQQ